MYKYFCKKYINNIYIIFQHSEHYWYIIFVHKFQLFVRFFAFSEECMCILWFLSLFCWLKFATGCKEPTEYPPSQVCWETTLLIWCWHVSGWCQVLLGWYLPVSCWCLVCFKLSSHVFSLLFFTPNYQPRIVGSTQKVVGGVSLNPRKPYPVQCSFFIILSQSKCQW